MFQFVEPNLNYMPNITENGKCLTWDCMKVHDSVAIILYNKSSNKLVFVRQFRPAVFFAYLCKNIDSLDSNVFSDDNIHNINKLLDKHKKIGYTLELCAGIIDKEGKTPQQIAKEEVEEETGYKVELKNETPKGKGGGIGDEQIEVIELTIEETKQLLFCEDSDAILSRPAGLLFGVSWFIYQHLPTL